MELQHFDLCSGVLVQDAMHDLLEGVLQYETKLLLCHYVNNGNFTLQNLNMAIEHLELPNNMESDRPAPIDRNTLYSEGNLLKQKGSYLAYKATLVNSYHFMYMQQFKCGY